MDCDHVPGDRAAAIGTVLGLVGDRWSLWVVRTLTEGPMRYSQLLDTVPGISQRMLTRTLGRLAASALVAPLIDWADTHHERLSPVVP